MLFSSMGNNIGCSPSINLFINNLLNSNINHKFKGLVLISPTIASIKLFYLSNLAKMPIENFKKFCNIKEENLRINTNNNNTNNSNKNKDKDRDKEVFFNENDLELFKNNFSINNINNINNNNIYKIPILLICEKDESSFIFKESFECTKNFKLENYWFPVIKENENENNNFFSSNNDNNDNYPYILNKIKFPQNSRRKFLIKIKEFVNNIVIIENEIKEKNQKNANGNYNLNSNSNSNSNNNNHNDNDNINMNVNSYNEFIYTISNIENIKININDKIKNDIYKAIKRNRLESNLEKIENENENVSKAKRSKIYLHNSIA